jgi:coatomer subunit beta'
MVQKLGDTASEAGINNVAFMANFVLGNLEECLNILVKTNRLPEAAFFARTYLPSEISRILPLWKAELVKIHYLGIITGSQQEGWCHLCAGYQI